jgi:predicted dehydrogenase
MQRRSFLVSGAFAAAQSWAGANDRVRIAVIGVGGRGTAHVKEILPLANAEVAALVDPDGRRTEQTASIVRQRTNKSPKLESDMRRVFDDKDIDAVTIATTNHWHALTAIWAMQAGKDAYVEKPVSHNYFEGVKLVECARKYKRICQGGTQRRAWGIHRKAMELLHGGAIGDVYQANFIFPGRRDSIGFKEVKPVPSWLNWDLWLGPAPMQEYHENLVHYNWHWFWDFGNGELGNNGIHLVDIARWGLQKRLPVKIYSTGGRFGYKDQAQTPNTQNVVWMFEDGSQIVGQLRGLYTAETMGWDFWGSKGHMRLNGDREIIITMGRNKTPEPAVEFPKNLDHIENFCAAVKSRNQGSLLAEIEETHLSTAFCHLGNISYRLGREMKFDPAKGKFVNDGEGDQLLTRKYRAPYIVPDKV